MNKLVLRTEKRAHDENFEEPASRLGEDWTRNQNRSDLNLARLKEPRQEIVLSHIGPI